MTSPHRPRATSDNRLEVLSDWFDVNSKLVTGAVIAIAVVVGGWWFYTRSQHLKAERAERALYSAQQSMAGNMPLAESDLRKLITRYDGTPAAKQAVLTLAQLEYDQGKHQQGITILKNAMAKLESSEEFGASGHIMMAAGYEQLRKFVEAAGEYEAAAKRARFDEDRQRYESLAANAYLLGGRKDDAKRIWTVLAADSKGTVAGEARVRLGEMLAVPATAAPVQTKS
ncbi:MAG: tetratricopeptide repeat protein [Gemmatimonadaceae bacterium]